MHLTIVLFPDLAELEYKLEISDFDVVVGASLANEISRKKGMESVLIYWGEEAIIASIKEAKQMVKVIRKENGKSKILQSVLEFTSNGIIAINSSGDVIICNPFAEKIIRVNASKIIRQNISKTLPQIELEEVLNTRQNYFIF